MITYLLIGLIFFILGLSFVHYSGRHYDYMDLFIIVICSLCWPLVIIGIAIVFGLGVFFLVVEGISKFLTKYN